MGYEVERWWEPSFDGLTRADRGGCQYRAYVPDPLADWDPSLSASLMADVIEVETAFGRLGEGARSAAPDAGAALLLMRGEAVASSRIEGLAVGPRRLLEAQALPARLRPGTDHVAAEVLANIAAMRLAIALGEGTRPITLDDLLAIHEVLMSESRRPNIGGRLRTVQNWLGGGARNPCRATYVPPPPELVPDLMDDLVAYLGDDSHPALIQAAIAHAQFETIHPFADGKGRTGRALIHVVLRRRGVSAGVTPPISVALAGRIDEYIAGLTAFRHLGGPQELSRSAAASSWLEVVVEAGRRACAHADAYTRGMADLRRRWRGQATPLRANSAAALLVDLLPGSPIVSIGQAAELIGRSPARTGAAVDRLVRAGVLRPRELGRRRYRVFEAPDAIELIVDLERDLTS